MTAGARDRIDLAALTPAASAAAEPALAPGPAAIAPHAGLLLVVAVALVDEGGRVLIARRPEGKQHGGLWEFPGGKVEPGETPEAAALRELWEELGVEPCRRCIAPFSFASHALEDGRHLFMPLYICRTWDGIARPLDGQELAWVRPAALTEYPMPPADIPLAVELRERLG